VRYGRLVDIGRKFVEDRVGRGTVDAARRSALRRGLLSRPLFGAALMVGRIAKGFLPKGLAASIPDARDAGAGPSPAHRRQVVSPRGCVQPSLAPNIDAATARVLDRAGISAIAVDDGGGCCGALSLHLSEHDEAKALARRTIDAWWPHVERGIEAIVVTASGCGVTVREYDHLLAHDGAYAEKAKRVAALARDPVEVVGAQWPTLLPRIDRARTSRSVAFQAPCTQQHGMKIRGQVERLLAGAGFTLVPVADAHLCCGSAGTYSILQPELSSRLKANKLAALRAHRPDVIASANIGCITHLASGTPLPVRHWIELVDDATSPPRRVSESAPKREARSGSETNGEPA
jgi:glycolate oxidase iron-sulfur subunit